VSQFVAASFQLAAKWLGKLKTCHHKLRHHWEDRDREEPIPPEKLAEAAANPEISLCAIGFTADDTFISAFSQAALNCQSIYPLYPIIRLFV
jgi:hypothetical protein